MELVVEKYKQTEIGLIPNDWELVQLESLTTKIGSGITPTGGSTVYKEDGRPFVRSQNVGWGNLILDDIAFIDDDTHQTFPNTEIKLNDVFLNISGASIGRSSYASEELVGGNVNQHVCIIRNIESKLNPIFLNLFLLSKSGQKQIDSFQSGGNRQGLNIGQIRTFLIPLPPTLKEQTSIASALSNTNALISSIEKLIAKKRNIKQGAMQKLLEPKEGWEHKTLGEIGEITGAGIDKLINEDEFSVRLVNYMDVFRRDFIYSNELNHWVTAPQSKINKCAVKKGDIFFTPSSEMRFDIAISAIAMEDIPDAAYSYHLVRLRLFEDWDLHFRTYIFKTKYFLSQAEQICEGSGKRYVITLPKFRSMKIFYPPIKEEQIRIATILSDMDAEINALESKLEKYRNVKLGMMQNLLTGKIRLV
jgi:type I restriction enzyme S subunit